MELELPKMNLATRYGVTDGRFKCQHITEMLSDNINSHKKIKTLVVDINNYSRLNNIEKNYPTIEILMKNYNE